MSTLLLNHFNGSDGATTFTDEIGGITWSRPGGLGELDTAQAKFGASSLLIPTSTLPAKVIGSGFSSPHAGNWTAEVFVRFAADAIIRIWLNDGSNHLQGQLILTQSTNEWSYSILDSSDNLIADDGGGVTINANTWYHVAFVCDSVAMTHALYFNGTRISRTINGTDIRSFDRMELEAAGSNVSHWFDEARLTNGAEYSGSTYIVPTTEFTLGSTTNVETFSAELGREVSDSAISLWATPGSAEFDQEISDSGAVFSQADLQSEYDFEAGNTSVVQAYAQSVDEYESGWEASYAQDAVPGAMEFDLEIQSIGIPTDYFIGAGETPLEIGWDADSPGLSSRGFLRGVTPHRRRIIAGRASMGRLVVPRNHPEVDPSRRTEIVRVLR